MPTLRASIPHNLGADEAKKRISNLVTDSKTRFSHLATDVQERWDGSVGHFSMKAMGLLVSGTLHVEPSVVNVEIDLPFAALPFRSRIEQQLVTHARELLT